MKGYWYLIALAVLGAIITGRHHAWPVLLIVLGWLWILYHRHRIPLSVLNISLIAAFYILVSVSSSTATAGPFDENVVLTGKVNSAVINDKAKTEFLFKTDAPLQEKVKVVYFKSEKAVSVPATWKRGSVCSIKGELQTPEGETNPGEFSYRKYLAGQNIPYQLIINDIVDVECNGQSIVSYADDFRNYILLKVDKSLDLSTAGWMKALLFGQKEDLPEETVKLFQEWGLSHLLAISGFHVGLLAMFLRFLFIKSNILTKEKTVICLMIFFPFYIILAGESPSVWRACLMGGLALLLLQRQRKFTSIDILSIVFLLLTLFNPVIIFQLSFQFSFLVTFSLLLSKKLLRDIKHPVFVLLTISLISQLAVLPFQVDQFYILNPLSSLANLLFVPYFSFFVLPVLLMVLVAIYAVPFAVPLLQAAFLFVHNHALLLLDILTDFYFPWVVGTLSLFAFCFYFLFFYFFMWKWSAGENRKTMAAAVMIVCLMITFSVKPYLSEQGSVTALDVGQGDAIVIELPYRKGVVMIDVGGTTGYDFQSVSNDSYEEVIKPFLLSRGISHIDTIFLTHPDLDHAGNLGFFQQDFDLGLLLISNRFRTDLNNDSLLKASGFQKIQELVANRSYKVNGQYFEVLSPDRDMGTANENSLVLTSTFGTKKWLFSGDIEEKAEKNLIKLYPGLNVDVLKIAHHGSKTSTTDDLIETITPETAIISVGRENRYGHPAKETLEKLEKKEIDIIRTDENGAVQYFYKQADGNFVPYIK